MLIWQCYLYRYGSVLGYDYFSTWWFVFHLYGWLCVCVSHWYFKDLGSKNSHGFSPVMFYLLGSCLEATGICFCHFYFRRKKLNPQMGGTALVTKMPWGLSGPVSILLLAKAQGKESISQRKATIASGSLWGAQFSLNVSHQETLSLCPSLTTIPVSISLPMSIPWLIFQYFWVTCHFNFLLIMAHNSPNISGMTVPSCCALRASWQWELCVQRHGGETALWLGPWAWGWVPQGGVGWGPGLKTWGGGSKSVMVSCTPQGGCPSSWKQRNPRNSHRGGCHQGLCLTAEWSGLGLWRFYRYSCEGPSRQYGSL